MWKKRYTGCMRVATHRPLMTRLVSCGLNISQLLRFFGAFKLIFTLVNKLVIVVME